MRALAAWVLVVAAVAVAGCARLSVPSDVGTTGQRIWVVRTTTGGDTLYRCADGADESQPPRPLCVQAPMTGPSR